MLSHMDVAQGPIRDDRCTDDMQAFAQPLRFILSLSVFLGGDLACFWASEVISKTNSVVRALHRQNIARELS